MYYVHYVHTIVTNSRRPRDGPSIGPRRAALPSLSLILLLLLMNVPSCILALRTIPTDTQMVAHNAKSQGRTCTVTRLALA